MRHIFLTVLFFLICSSAFTQVVNTTDTTTPKAFSYVEQMPVPGYNFMGYIKKNIHYPETAIKNGTEGRVILKFIVNEDGRISDCNVLRGLDSACNEESIRLIMTMPAWNPGKQNGKAVKVYYTQTIAFKLPGKNNLDEDALPDKNRVYNTADQMPAPVYDLNEYISEAIFYPDSARMKHISGKVVVSFVVNEDGTISDCDVSSGIGAGCDEEALRVIRTMPAWEPGTIKGIPVKVALAQPITFDLKGYDLNKDSSLSINKVYTYVDRMPSADYLLSTYLTSYIHYPEYARDHNQQGRAVTQFVVNEDGTISNCKIIRTSGFASLDSEALRVISNMPAWKPGKQDGRPVKILFTQPVSFTIQNGGDKVFETFAKPKCNMEKYVSNNMHYPEAALKDNIRGMVKLTFNVNADGSISDCIIIKGIGYGCDEEAIRLVKSMPAWQPAKIGKESIRQLVSRKIYFSPDGDQEITNTPARNPRTEYDMNKYLTDSVKMPSVVISKKINGRVYLRFVVNKDGSVSDCEIQRGLNKECDEEALRLIRNCPRWVPGRYAGKPVNTYWSMSISFSAN